jgi:hypothetical protein
LPLPRPASELFLYDMVDDVEGKLSENTKKQSPTNSKMSNWEENNSKSEINKQKRKKERKEIKKEEERRRKERQKEEREKTDGPNVKRKKGDETKFKRQSKFFKRYVISIYQSFFLSLFP